MSALSDPGAVVTLACTACELVYEPAPADFGTGNTGCPQCGGWTWIAQLGTAGLLGGSSGDRLTPSQQRAGIKAVADPAVTPPRTPAGSISPTTSR